ncbi:MAG: thiamine phosphate synthase [Myxococcales bacterium]|nr:thiamine phosphate synthase [Myxococcales bacterium]
MLLSCDGHALAAACALLPRAPALAGLQLRGDPSADTLRAARSLLGPQSLLGRSCHGAPRPAAEHGLVDYTCFAPVFSPTTRQAGVDKRAAGIEALRAWTRADGAHVLALGGVTPSTAAACVTAGARGLAGIGVFFGDPGRVVEDVHALRVALPRP